MSVAARPVPHDRLRVAQQRAQSLVDFNPVILDDPDARQYVRGVAVHDYAGDDPSVLEAFRIRYPDMPLRLTERSYYGVDGEIHEVSGQRQAGVRRVIDFYRNGITSWTYWITFLDTNGQPNTGPLDASCCSVPFTAPPGNLDAYTTNRDYYLYGQFSRFVRPGAVRIGSDQTSTEVGNVAFRNPDGSIVAVVANAATAPRSVRISSPDGVVVDTLPALSVGTYRWAGGPAPADPRLGTFRLVNRADPNLALQSAGDHYPGSADSYNVVASPTAWNGLEQRWIITSAGGGYHRLVNKARGTVLQATCERYGGFADVFHTAASPAAWNLAEQQWRLISG